MPNIGCRKNKDTSNKFENLEISEPISLESLACEQHKLLEECSKSDTSRIVHSDPEQTQAKTKTRSRFSNALRKLSRSARKKEKSSLRSHSSTATESSEQIISSGTEDLLEGNLSPAADKKSKKKKRSLFSLKRSKIAPKTDDLKVKLEQEELKTEKLLEPIFQDTQNELVVTTERLTPVTGRSKVQITIKSKKIETLASKEETNENPSNSSQPSPTKQTDHHNDTLTQSSNDPLVEKKTLKTKTTTTTQTSQKPTTTATITTATQSRSKQRDDEKEQITITQSSKDTPPKERAPTKPSRLSAPTAAATTAATSQASTSSGAVRKTATTTRAALKLVAGAKSKQKSSSAKTPKGSAAKKETDLMINPQRGHRLPRPTSTTATTLTSSNTNKESPSETATSPTAEDTATIAQVEATTEETITITAPSNTSKESPSETATSPTAEDTATTVQVEATFEESTTTIASSNTKNERRSETATSSATEDTATTVQVEATSKETITSNTNKESPSETVTSPTAEDTVTTVQVEATSEEAITSNTNKESPSETATSPTTEDTVTTTQVEATSEETTTTRDTIEEKQLAATAVVAVEGTLSGITESQLAALSEASATAVEIQSIDQTTATLPTISSDQKQTKTNIADCLTTLESLPQTSAEIQSSIANASLETPPPPTNTTATAIPTTPSPTVTTTDDITTTRQQQHQQQQENIQPSPTDNSNSVQLKPFPETDDHISIAESVKPVEDLGNLYYNDPLEAVKEPVSVHFAVGSPVRAPFPQPLYEYSIEEPSIGSQKYSEENSETNLRPIHYISQATLSDELNSLELRRSRYRYQSGVSDLSLDTCENRDTFDDPQQMPAFGDLTMDQDTEPTVMTSANTEKREHLYKILVIGELGTGKTSFIKRYVHQFFSQNYRATIGVDFALKVLHWDPNTVVRLQLWDIAGQERFGNMTRVYYKEAVGAFIVFDVTRSGTFDCVSKWKEDLDSKVQLPDGSSIPCILLANKCDQDKQGIVTNNERMDEYVKEHGFAGWFETSAKENINIDEAARALVNKILLNDKLISAADLADSEKFNLNNTAEQTTADGRNKCSC